MRTYFLLCLYLLTFTKVSSQRSTALEQIGIEEGLSQGYVTAILQDKEGFLWVGTQNGLNRYDGYRFRVFEHNPYEQSSLSENSVVSLAEAGDFLLVGTASTGLNLFHKKTERFFHVPFERKESKNNTAIPYLSKLISGDAIIKILPDRAGNIWLTTSNYPQGPQFLIKMTPPKGFWDNLPQNPTLIDQIQMAEWDIYWPNKINELVPDALMLQPLDGGRNIAVCRVGKWHTYDSVSNLLVPINWPSPVAEETINLVSARDGTACFWQNKMGDTWFSPTGQFDGLKLANRLSRILFFDKRFLWISTPKNTIQVFQMTTDPSRIDFSKPEWEFESNDFNYIFCVDAASNFWFGQSAKGIFKFNPNKVFFQHFFPGKSIMTVIAPGEPGAYVASFGVYGLGTSNPSEEKRWATYNRFLKQKDLIPYHIKRMPEGDYWSLASGRATGDLCLIRNNPATGRLSYYPIPLNIRRIAVFDFDETGKIWLSVAEKLLCFDPETGASSTFDYSHLGSQGITVFALQKTANGTWWLGTDKGLIKADSVAGEGSSNRFKFTRLSTNPNDRNSLNHNYIASLLIDPSEPNQLWIGTKGGGLNRLDTKTLTFQHITKQQGLPDNVIYGILADSSGHLWMSSNKGLICYTPENGNFKNYRFTDGLQSDEFNTGAFAKGLNGEFLFAGVNGLNVFFPNQINQNRLSPNTLITGLMVNNQPYIPANLDKKNTNTIPFCHKITLTANQNNLIFEFAALDFSLKNKNQYRYYLKGAEPEWAHKGTEPSATYLNLGPGTYTFVVTGSNNDLIWSDTPTELKVEILPPWYRSYWAYFTYLATIGCIIFSFFKSREKKLLLEIALEKRKNEAQQAALIMERQKVETLRLSQQLETERMEAAKDRAADKQKLDDFMNKFLEKTAELEYLKEQIADNKENEDKKHQQENHLESLQKVQILTEDDWTTFKLLFENVHPNFISLITEKYPTLTPAEQRLLLLYKIKLGAPKIAQMLGVAQETVKKTRYRLRKKLGIMESSVEDILKSMEE